MCYRVSLFKIDQHFLHYFSRGRGGFRGRGRGHFRHDRPPMSSMQHQQPQQQPPPDQYYQQQGPPQSGYHDGSQYIMPPNRYAMFDYLHKKQFYNIITAMVRESCKKILPYIYRHMYWQFMPSFVACAIVL